MERPVNRIGRSRGNRLSLPASDVLNPKKPGPTSDGQKQAFPMLYWKPNLCLACDVSTDTCDIVAKQPENAFETGGFASEFLFTTLPDQFCKRDGVFITQVKGFAAYILPKVDLQVSGTFQSLPGLPITANANLGSEDPFGRSSVAVTGVQAFVPYFQIVEITARFDF